MVPVVRAADMDGDGTPDVVAVEIDEVNELHWYETDASTATFTDHKISEFADQEVGLAPPGFGRRQRRGHSRGGGGRKRSAGGENGGPGRHAIDDDTNKELFTSWRPNGATLTYVFSASQDDKEIWLFLNDGLGNFGSAVVIDDNVDIDEPPTPSTSTATTRSTSSTPTRMGMCLILLRAPTPRRTTISAT